MVQHYALPPIEVTTSALAFGRRSRWRGRPRKRDSKVKLVLIQKIENVSGNTYIWVITLD